jgi:Suppressor of forked protein (Suf)
MTSDPRRRKPVLLNPPSDDAMDEDDDEDELFGDAEGGVAVPQAVTHTLLDNFITPSPFPHHTTGPTSSRFRNAFTRIVANPSTDTEAWQALMTEVVNCYREIQSKVHIMDAEIQLQLDWIESCYGTLLKYFPYSVQHICGVAELLVAQSARVGEEHGPLANIGLDLQRQANAQAKLEHLIASHLGIHMDGSPIDDIFGMVTHSVDIWMIYISARIRQGRREHPGEEAVVRDWATKAYELALEYVGFGFQNHVLWKAYLQYLKVATSGDPQHMSILRQVYQRLVCHPMTGLDQLWQEYEHFERQQSEALAQALLGEFTPKYQHARTIYLERNRVFNVQDLHMDRLATPPQDVSEEHPCLQLWKTRTAYERTNPERLSSSDLAVRIRTCYKEMVCSWTRHPEVWHMWSMWEESAREIGRAFRVLELGQKNIPDCTLLAYTQAQLVELHEADEPSKCLAVMETFLERAPNTLGYALYQQMVRRYKGKEAARAVFSKARRALVTHAETGETAAAVKPDEVAAEGEEATDVKKEDIVSSKVWMVTNRLNENVGKSIAITKDDTEKKAGPITWHLYASHATIEHRINHAPAVAARVYELGLRKHGSFLTQPAYVLRYAHLLLELKDTVNLRALLTRALAACSNRKSPQVAALWDMAVQFESLVSIVDPTNVPAVAALEKKRRIALLGPDVEDVATGIRVGLGDQPTIGAQKSSVAEHLVRQDGYELSSSIVNGMSRTVDVLDIMGLWGSGNGNSCPLGSTIVATQAVEDEEEIIPGGKSDMLYQKRQQYAKILATGSSMGGGDQGGADGGSRLVSARERLHASSLPGSQSTPMVMAVQNSPEWLRELLMLLPATRLRTSVIAKPPPHLTEMALAGLRQNKLPDERPQDDKKTTGNKHKGGGDGDSSDEEDGTRGNGGYGTQFRARQRSRLEGQNGMMAEQ